MEWDKLPTIAQWIILGLAAVVGWLARQGWRIANNSVSSYRTTIDERLEKIEGDVSDLQRDIRALEERDVQMLDEEERARKKEIDQLRQEMQAMMQSIQAEIRSIRQEWPDTMEKIIRASMQSQVGGEGKGQ